MFMIDKIDNISHYFLLSWPMDYVPFLGYFGKTYGFGSPEIWAEFKVVEEQYKVEDGYKIELRGIDPIYGKETFYQEDFCSMVESGYIIKKTNEHQHVEDVTWMEPFCCGLNLVHTASVVVND